MLMLMIRKRTSAHQGILQNNENNYKREMKEGLILLRE